MKRFFSPLAELDARDLVALVGVCLIAGGCYELLGLGAALAAAGVLSIAGAMRGAK